MACIAIFIFKVKHFFQEFSIETTPVSLRLANGSTFQVPEPSSHIGPKPIPARLVSNFRTSEMLGRCGCSIVCRCIRRQEPHDAIVFHLQGGGYVSQVRTWPCLSPLLVALGESLLLLNKTYPTDMKAIENLKKPT